MVIVYRFKYYFNFCSLLMRVSIDSPLTVRVERKSFVLSWSGNGKFVVIEEACRGKSLKVCLKMGMLA